MENLFIVLGIAALAALGGLLVRRAFSRESGRGITGVVLFAIVVACMFGLLILDFARGFSGVSLKFTAFVVGYFLLFMVPVGLVVLAVRRRRGWDNVEQHNER